MKISPPMPVKITPINEALADGDPILAKKLMDQGEKIDETTYKLAYILDIPSVFIFLMENNLNYIPEFIPFSEAKNIVENHIRINYQKELAINWQNSNTKKQENKKERF